MKMAAFVDRDRTIRFKLIAELPRKPMTDPRYLLLPLLFLLRCTDVVLWVLVNSFDWAWRTVVYARMDLHDWIARKRCRR